MKKNIFIIFLTYSFEKSKYIITKRGLYGKGDDPLKSIKKNNKKIFNLKFKNFLIIVQYINKLFIYAGL